MTIAEALAFLKEAHSPEMFDIWHPFAAERLGAEIAAYRGRSCALDARLFVLVRWADKAAGECPA